MFPVANARAPRGRVPHPGKIFFVFMQFLRQIGQNIRLVALLGISAPPGNPGSTTDFRYCVTTSKNWKPYFNWLARKSLMNKLILFL